jgi:hypothetical protein
MDRVDAALELVGEYPGAALRLIREVVFNEEDKMLLEIFRDLLIEDQCEAAVIVGRRIKESRTLKQENTNEVRSVQLQPTK